MQSKIVNTELYPIDNLSSTAAKSLIGEIRTRLEQDGSCTLANFVTQQALTEMARQACELTHLAYPGPVTQNLGDESGRLSTMAFR